jgi:hypothetical protein
MSNNTDNAISPFLSLWVKDIYDWKAFFILQNKNT